MKKTTVFPALIIVVGILLFLLKVTGLPAHIGLSVAGLVLLIAYTVMTKKLWTKPALEILMRLCYAVALISGAVIMNVQGLAVLAIVHKVCAALFVVLFIVIFAGKSRAKA